MFMFPFSRQMQAKQRPISVGGAGNVDHLLRFGYCLMTVALLLMIWSSLARASGQQAFLDQLQQHPPCMFYAMCTCSQSDSALGIMQCRNVPFPAIPARVNVSKVWALHMENTGLRELEPYFLQATGKKQRYRYLVGYKYDPIPSLCCLHWRILGLYRLDLSFNPLTDVPDDAFAGLERSLSQLMLRYNELIEVPSRAVRHLQKLKHFGVYIITSHSSSHL